MTDIVNPQKRSLMMAGIKSKNTKPEKLIRTGLFGLGYRYRIHVKDLPAKPDLVLRKYSAVILVNGCFWHGHDCSLFRLPKSNIEFWESKISKNKENDNLNLLSLRKAGWRVAVVWECALKGKSKLNYREVISLLDTWLKSGIQTIEIRGITVAN